MTKDTSILVGDYYEQFIRAQIQTGKFSSASEVVKAALRLFEQEEMKKAALINALAEGEASGLVDDFDSTQFLKQLHQKYPMNDL